MGKSQVFLEKLSEIWTLTLRKICQACLRPKKFKESQNMYMKYSQTTTIANCMVCLAKKKVINLKMAPGRAETCR
jgi:hypothetical protein